MTPERARERARKLLALAGPTSGASENERRNAAVQATTLILEHHLLDGGQPPINLDQVTELALHAAELEHLVASERAAHAAQVRQRDQEWRQHVEKVRKEERAAAHAKLKTVARRAVVEDRSAQGRAGGRERAARLSAEEKSAIGKAGAEERWRKWRAERGLEPR